MKFTKEIEIVSGTHKRPTFLIGIPTLGMVPIEWAMMYGRMQFPVNCSSAGMAVKNMEVGVARNFIGEQLRDMKPQPEYLFFLGDDMLPSWNSFLILYEEMLNGNWDILSGLYHMKAPDTMPIPVTWRNDIKGCLKHGIHYQVGEVVPVDVVGLDFCLIRSNIFEKMGKPPWFKTADSKDMCNEAGAMSPFTEDVFFCRKAKEAGLKIGVHTAVRIGHLFSTGEVF